jgi:methylase of polypeptide subunit release factors
MSKYMDFNRKRFNSANLGGKRVLELGSGCGVAGVGFMLRGADVTFSDLDPVAQGLTQYNAEVRVIQTD